MKIRTYFFVVVATLVIIGLWSTKASAQQYKLKQVTSMMNMKSETTIYVKGMRKRTETEGFAGAGNNINTIEQCDLQRIISISDKKKLYYIEPFSKQSENIVYEGANSSQKTKPVATQVSAPNQQGGLITMWYNITDTGERKKMHGVMARHVWTSQKIKPSDNACMKDSMLIKTDGWYIDLPEFNCPVVPTATYAGGPQAANGCQDKYVIKQTGKGKLGFPLIETRTMIMGDGSSQSSTFETSVETIEFSTAKLDSLLFEIPAGYTLAKSMNELYGQVDAMEMAEQYIKMNADQKSKKTSSQSKTTSLRLAVLEPGNSDGLTGTQMQQYIVNMMGNYDVEAIAVTSPEQAKEFNCDLLLNTNNIRIKQASKVGGILRAVRNIDPYAASTYNVEAQMVLSKVNDGTTVVEKNVSGKFEGTAERAIKKALDEGGRMIVEELKR